jgi:hypothetical protein
LIKIMRTLFKVKRHIMSIVAQQSCKINHLGEI